MFRKLLVAILLLALIGSSVVYQCQPDRPKPAAVTTPPPTPEKPPAEQVAVPTFNADSAYYFVKKQVAFGPRVPNTPAHKKCAAWMSETFKGLGLTVIEQRFKATHFKGTTFDCVNVIAQYKPENPRRILFAAHWDSRFQADKDTKDANKPIDGADDGGSGIAVMLEMARVLARNPVDIGVDFICFDAEDQGDDGGESETWCLGSQYWSKNLHKAGYQPYQAILLDMVGAKGARFPREGISTEVAPATVDKIWRLAASLGYSAYFENRDVGGITDDHLFVIRNARIPMVDIVSMPGDDTKRFGDYHHKHADNMSIIDPATLKAVGQVCVAFIYQTFNQAI